MLIFIAKGFSIFKHTFSLILLIEKVKDQEKMDDLSNNFKKFLQIKVILRK